MKKKYAENSDDENEFEVDEPEEIQNNASDDDWTPDKDNSSGRRTSTRLRNIPKSRAPIIDASSTDEEEGSDENSGKRKGKGRGRGRQPMKKHKVSSSTTPSSLNKSTSDNNSAKSDSEPTSTTTPNFVSSPSVVKLNNKDFTVHLVSRPRPSPSSRSYNKYKSGYESANSDSKPSSTTKLDFPIVKIMNKYFTSGAFVVLKTDAANLEQDPPLWKIDGKALLQKYIPYDQDGKTYYKNTSVYSGWTINNKDNYYPVTVIFKQQTRKEHIVEFQRDQLKLNEESSEVSSSQSSNKTIKKEKIDSPKPVIKVKSFAVLPEEEANTPATPIVEKTTSTSTNLLIPIQKVNKNYVTGAFLVLRSESSNPDPPIWKIDGKSLLQKYCAYVKDGKTLYKNTPEYSGWSINNKRNYFPVSVTFKQQHKKEHIVELNRIKWDEPDELLKED